MTDPTKDNDPVWLLGSPTAGADPGQTRFFYTIRRLRLARNAMEMALLAAGEVAREAQVLQRSPGEIQVRWESANHMVNAVFRSLNHQVDDAIITMDENALLD